jgi:hypothetical protein
MENRGLVCTSTHAPTMFRYRDADDHRDAADELEEDVGRSGDRGQWHAGLGEEWADADDAAAGEVVHQLRVGDHDHTEADAGQ